MELEVQPQQQLTGNKQQSRTVRGNVDPKQDPLCQAPLGCLLSTKHTWCWRCFAGMKRRETWDVWVYFSPLQIQEHSTGLNWGWAQQICPTWPCQGLCPLPMGSEGHCCPPVLVQPQELWLVIKSPLLRLSDLLGSSSMAPGGTSKLGFYFISSKFPSH